MDSDNTQSEVMTKTSNVSSRNPLYRGSIRYNGVYYDGICTAAKSLMIEFMKTAFENLPDNHIFKYHEDQNYSKISILDKMTFNMESVDKRPAIVISRGGLSYSKTGITSRYDGPFLQRREDSDEKCEGATKHTGLIRGSLLIQCYGKGQTLQAEQLGESVFELITDMETALKEIGFFECYASGIGEENGVVAGSKLRLIMVPVVVTFSMQRSWSITPVNLRRLNQILVENINKE